MGLDGPSRTIEITPTKEPAIEPRELPQREAAPVTEPEPEKVPAGV
jgi:hypothetical protein